jgi:hypothetical protein
MTDNQRNEARERMERDYQARKGKVWAFIAGIMLAFLYVTLETGGAF